MAIAARKTATSTSRRLSCSSSSTCCRKTLNAAIESALASLDLDLPSGSAAQFGVLLDELERWNKKINLTAIRKRQDMVTGHIVDSLVACPLLEGERLLDVGTGPGFPGLPLAIAQPMRQFTLLDSNNKKVQFIDHAVARLGLQNVTAVWSRAEHYAPERRFDTVIARALATVPTLLKIAGDHLSERGVFIALKGRGFREELDALPEGWDCTPKELDAPGLPPGSRHAVLLRRKH